jgi:hypothetical protein
MAQAARARLAALGLRAQIASTGYDDWPRGRIVYEIPARRFVIYADAALGRHKIIAAQNRFRAGWLRGGRQKRLALSLAKIEQPLELAVAAWGVHRSHRCASWRPSRHGQMGAPTAHRVNFRRSFTA